MQASFSYRVEAPTRAGFHFTYYFDIPPSFPNSVPPSDAERTEIGERLEELIDVFADPLARMNGCDSLPAGYLQRVHMRQSGSSVSPWSGEMTFNRRYVADIRDGDPADPTTIEYVPGYESRA